MQLENWYDVILLFMKLYREFSIENVVATRRDINVNRIEEDKVKEQIKDQIKHDCFILTKD